MRDSILLCYMADNSDHIDKQLKNLGERIKQIRKAKGFSNYEKFAHQHDFNRSSYGRFESGEDIRFSSLLRVLDAFDMDIQDFFAEGFEKKKKKNRKKPK